MKGIKKSKKNLILQTLLEKTHIQNFAILQNKDCGESTIIDNNETKNNANQPKKIQQNKNENEVKLDMKKIS